MWLLLSFFFFFFNDTATTEIYTLSLHDALPIWPHASKLIGRWAWESANFIRDTSSRARRQAGRSRGSGGSPRRSAFSARSEEHTSELQSLAYLVCRLLLEKKKKDSKIARILPSL